MDPQHIDDELCRLFRRSAELAGKKWNAAILLALARGAERFSAILGSVEGLSDRLLAARLRELESHGLVAREVVPSVPVQILYRLTPAGSELIGILHPLVQWSQRWEQEPAERQITAPV
ncbi:MULTISPECIES: winged helix-turn-helix transcriptional regulator [Microbacterium]|uniref:winged helix-turn-helix transcriptional regulator n=1 Tax=Microbacterium TaxID=33882 RepID=UPI00051A58F1|nr:MULTISPECIES: helix-turn-helix domain-containing protein [Microbacterium]MCE7482195.1 helix-turn-helix transcriptional regulator [Microbacterium profundi]